MTLLEALKTGLKMRRPNWTPEQYMLMRETEHYFFSKEDIFADDWQVNLVPRELDLTGNSHPDLGVVVNGPLLKPYEVVKVREILDNEKL